MRKSHLFNLKKKEKKSLTISKRMKSQKKDTDQHHVIFI